jgi:hypothetical protein
MLDFYYLWCLIAFIFGLIWFFLCIYYYIFEKTDIETNNYKEVGMSYNFFSMWFEEGKVDWGDFVFWIFICFWIWVLLSWLSVVVYVFGIIKKIKWYFFDLPNDVKEEIKKSKFKLKNSKLSSKKEINELIYFINHWQEINQSWDLSQNLLLWKVDTSPEDNEYRRSRMYIYYDKVELWGCNTPVVTDSILEYKIDWNKVLWRVIEERREDPMKEDFYPIKNWKVCKDEEIRKYFTALPEKLIEERINDYKDLVKWFKVNDEITDYVLYYNLSSKDFKKYAESKIENLKIGEEIDKDLNEKYKEWITGKKLETYKNKKLKEYWLTEQDIWYSWTRDKDIKRLKNILNWRIYG